MDFEQAIMDGEVLGAFRAISAPVTSLLGALERLSENPVGVVPQQGGCHEVDHLNNTAVTGRGCRPQNADAHGNPFARRAV